jgi:hypothetical protein
MPLITLEESQEPMTAGSWVVLELFGHKVVSGLMTKDESLGAPLIRLDVPPTSGYPAFTRHYNPSAIYSVSYVSEDTARLTAEQLQENPISIYVPDLGDLSRLKSENEAMRARIESLQRAFKQPQLPEENEITHRYSG